MTRMSDVKDDIPVETPDAVEVVAKANFLLKFFEHTNRFVVDFVL